MKYFVFLFLFACSVAHAEDPYEKALRICQTVAEKVDVDSEMIRCAKDLAPYLDPHYTETKWYVNAKGVAWKK